ncbi:MAG: AAA family ATPase [Bacteroidales bacterium]
MNDSTKKQIADALRKYCELKGSQNKAARSLRNVSSATISHMLSGDWALIKVEMWRSLAKQIGFKQNAWQAVETRDFKMFTALMAEAQGNALVMAITGEAGTGKSFAAKNYVQNNPEAYLLSCADYWNKKMFLSELLIQMGKDCGGYTVEEMMREVVRSLKQADAPLIIIDEADKLSDSVLYFFITLYNQLEDHCGIIMCATDHLAKRLTRGRKLNKRGYKEIYSRMGRKFVELKGLGSADIAAVCRANEVEEKEHIQEVIEDCEGDMRRVKRKIHAIKQRLNAA